jgi:hypothetical protein
MWYIAIYSLLIIMFTPWWFCLWVTGRWPKYDRDSVKITREVIIDK